VRKSGKRKAKSERLELCPEVPNHLAAGCWSLELSPGYATK
jgi:hypothetical protein